MSMVRLTLSVTAPTLKEALQTLEEQASAAFDGLARDATVPWIIEDRLAGIKLDDGKKAYLFMEPHAYDGNYEFKVQPRDESIKALVERWIVEQKAAVQKDPP